MNVLVYRNVTRKVWSVCSLSGRLLSHKKRLTLRDAKFVVRPGGRQRVLAEGRKNVHAFVRGILAPAGRGTGRIVRYNPYQTKTFVDRAGRPVLTAKEVTLRQDGRARAVGVNT